VIGRDDCDEAMVDVTKHSTRELPTLSNVRYGLSVAFNLNTNYMAIKQ
jgi:hypothetical protein